MPIEASFRVMTIKKVHERDQTSKSGYSWSTISVCLQWRLFQSGPKFYISTKKYTTSPDCKGRLPIICNWKEDKSRDRVEAVQKAVGCNTEPACTDSNRLALSSHFPLLPSHEEGSKQYPCSQFRRTRSAILLYLSKRIPFWFNVSNFHILEAGIQMAFVKRLK